ncbi:MAG: SCO family protein [Thermodesulfobacteriota bacterium]
MNKKYVLYIAFLVLIVSLFAAIVFGTKLLQEKESLYGELIEREAPDFSLTDHNGSKYNFSEHKGKKIILMNFGYTNCPDVCPTTLATLRNVLVDLGEDANEVEVLFITVDPERDTVEKLNKYITYFHTNITGLTGTPDEIENVAGAYKIFFFKEDEKSDTEYLMSHSPSIYLIDKNGNLFLKYPQNEIDPELVAKDIRKLK